MQKAKDQEKDRLKKKVDGGKNDPIQNYGNLLQKEHIKAIREKFYDTTSKLFFNWHKFTGKDSNNNIIFKINEFMEQENYFFNDNGWFYHNLFYNEFFIEPANKKEETNNPEN